MEVSITGTVMNLTNMAPSPFAMQFALAGGQWSASGCNTSTIGAQVTGFSAEIGNNAVAMPSDFAVNLASSCGYDELVGGQMLTLESQGPLFVSGAKVFDGNLGTYLIQDATVQIPATAVSEPGLAALFTVSAAAPFVVRRCRSRFR